MPLEVPEYLRGHVAQQIGIETDTAIKRSYWVVILGLAPKRDGNQWSFLWGDDLATGVAGFGDSPILAMEAFEKAMYEKLPDSKKPEEPHHYFPAERSFIKQEHAPIDPNKPVF